jgi:Membrane proteins related to metalloendopeptidases
MQSVQTVQSMQLMQSAITNNQHATPASEHSETARSGKSSFNNAPNFSGKWAAFPQVGDTIAGYQISSAFGPRKSPCPSCSSMHFGNDVATPMYTPLYAIRPVEGTVNVRCWDNGRWGWVASYSDWNGVSVSTTCIYPQATARVAYTKSRQYLREIGICSDTKSWARVSLNERHRQDYLKWSVPGNKDSVFLASW